MFVPKFAALLRFVRCLIVLLFAVGFLAGVQRGGAQTSVANPIAKAHVPAASDALSTPPRMRGTTQAQRRHAAAGVAMRRAAQAAAGRVTRAPRPHANAIVGIPGNPGGLAGTLPLSRADLYFSGIYPNYANSPLPQLADTANCANSVGHANGIANGNNYCGIRKFVDTLPLLNAPNDLGQQIPIAVADRSTFPGSDYYEIELDQYIKQMHSDLPPTHLLGYRQTNGPNGFAQPTQYLGPLIIAQRGIPVRVKFVNKLPAGTAGNLKIPTDLSAMGAGLGLAKDSAGLAYLQSRATVHLHGGATPWISDGTPHQWTVPVSEHGSGAQERGDSVSFVPDMFFDSTGKVIPQCGGTVINLCSDTSNLAKLPIGATNDPGPGALTFYYTNQQSARLMFYHDHAYGTTRLNVYSGEAAGYLLQDPVEADMVAGTDLSGVFGTASTLAGSVVVPTQVIPADQIPLVIQDKSFVPQNLAATASGTTVYSVPVQSVGSGYTAPIVSFSGGCANPPTALATFGDTADEWGNFVTGAITGVTLTFPGAGCTANPVVSICDVSCATPGPGTGASAFAYIATLSEQDPTWDSSIWGTYGDLWYPHVYMPNQWPGDPGMSGSNPMGRWDYASWFWPVFKSPGGYAVRGELDCSTPDSPGQGCPGTPSALDPADAKDLSGKTHLGVGSVASLTPEAFMDTPLVNGTAYPTLTLEPKPYRFRILSAGNDRTIALSWFLACDASFSQYANKKSATALPCPVPSAATPGIGTFTEVGMVPSAPTAGFPSYWPTDGRDGGVPDPGAAGPSWVVIGTEGGVLPAPAVIPAAPTNYEYNRRSITVTNTSSTGLELMPAERADVIVDFTNFANKTLILYNDAPAPNPAFDARYDYYTGDPDQSGTGGAPTTLAGFGPNTRTIMQVKISGSTTGNVMPAANIALLSKVLPAAFKIAQPVPIVPEAAYSKIYGQTMTNHYPNLHNTDITFTPIGAPAGTTVTMPLLFKTIQELFELDYGRMNATLGTELSFTNFNTQTTVPLGFIDPFTEDVYDSKNVITKPVGTLGDGSQVWMVIHNGVDSHAIHFHLENVQILDRVGWDGTVRPPSAMEMGWKDTVRMNPLEIDFVALRPVSMDLPFPVPDSSRLLDVTMPPGTDPNMSAFNPLNTGTMTQNNEFVTMGWEYVWHCHILGHEENDMMREETFQVAPEAPVTLSALMTGTGNQLIFTDKSLSETGFAFDRNTDITDINWLNPATITHVKTTIPANTQSSTNPGWNTTVTYMDTDATPSIPVLYRVQAFKPDADYWQPRIGFNQLDPNATTSSPPNLVSAWTNTAEAAPAPILTVTPNPLVFGMQPYLLPSTPLSVTLANIGFGPETLFGTSLVGGNTTDFSIVSSTCGPTLQSGTNCVVQIVFTPLNAATRTTTLQILSNDPANKTFNIPVTGTGGQVPLTITASSATIVFGSAAPQILPIVSGLVGTDTVASLGAISCSVTGYTQASLAGTYPTSCTGAVNANYNITYVTGKVTVTPGKASLILPLPGQLASSTTTFTWNSGGAVQKYELRVGTTGVGSWNLYGYGIQSASQSATVTTIPVTGVTIYVQLITLVNGVAQSNYYTFTAPGTPSPSTLISALPINGNQFTSSTGTFTWTPGVGVTRNELRIGTAASGSGSWNIYGYGIAQTGGTVTVNNLPTTGVTIYVQLISVINGVNQSNYYTFTAQGVAAPAVLTGPAATTFTSNSATFSWSPGTGVTRIELRVGVGKTGSGSWSIYGYGIAQTTGTVTVTGLPTGKVPVYVQLISTINGVAQTSYYTFTSM